MFALCCSSCCTCCCTYSYFFFLLLWLMWLVLFFFRFLFHVFSPCGCLACCCCWSSCSSCSCCSCYCFIAVFAVLLLFLMPVGIVGIIVAACCLLLLLLLVVAVVLLLLVSWLYHIKNHSNISSLVASSVLILLKQCLQSKNLNRAQRNVLCAAFQFDGLPVSSFVFQLINSGLSEVIELSLTITSSIGFQHAIWLPLYFLVCKRSTWNENTGRPPLLNADSSNFPELKPLVLEVPVDVGCTCVRICSKTKQTIYKVR